MKEDRLLGWRLNLKKSVAWRRKLSYIYPHNLFFRLKTKWILFVSKQRLVKNCGGLKDEIPIGAKLNSQPKWVLITCHQPSSIMSCNSNNPIILYNIAQHKLLDTKHTPKPTVAWKWDWRRCANTVEIRKTGQCAAFGRAPNSNSLNSLCNSINSKRFVLNYKLHFYLSKPKTETAIYVAFPIEKQNAFEL